MLECSYDSRLSAYYDGELDRADARNFESHLETCSECVTKIASMRAVSRLFHEAPAPRISEIGMARFHKAADAAAADQTTAFPFIRALIAVAASVRIVPIS